MCQGRDSQRNRNVLHSKLNKDFLTYWFVKLYSGGLVDRIRRPFCPLFWKPGSRHPPPPLQACSPATSPSSSGGGRGRRAFIIRIKGNP